MKLKFYVARAEVVPYDPHYAWHTLVDADNDEAAMEEARDFARGQMRPRGSTVRVQIFGPLECDEASPTAEGFLG